MRLLKSPFAKLGKYLKNLWPSAVSPDDRDVNQQQVYDLTELQQLVGNDTSFVIELLQVFISNMERNLEKLQECCQQGRWPMVGAIAHKLKPGCGHLNLHQLELLFDRIESQAQINPDKVKMDRLITYAINTFDRTRPLIQSEILRLQRTESLVPNVPGD